VIDRFSARAGHLMVRDDDHSLPAPNQPIDFDQPPFISHGLGPDGSLVRYYNFDIQSPAPANRYAFTFGDRAASGERLRVPGQGDVIDSIPGEEGYSDFWRLTWITVPPSFTPGSITSAAQVAALALPVEGTNQALDCPVVPNGSQLRERYGGSEPALDTVWYRGAQVSCALFAPTPALVDGMIPSSPIYVAFERDPEVPGGGPASGFRHEARSLQTHNVVFSVPGDLDYSPLWSVHIYSNADFAQVHDSESALRARKVADGPLVNCPVVSVSASVPRGGTSASPP
jgi:hypothetical protein